MAVRYHENGALDLTSMPEIVSLFEDPKILHDLNLGLRIRPAIRHGEACLTVLHLSHAIEANRCWRRLREILCGACAYRLIRTSFPVNQYLGCENTNFRKREDDEQKEAEVQIL